jgi:hypothetical protein
MIARETFPNDRHISLKNTATDQQLSFPTATTEFFNINKSCSATTKAHILRIETF